MFFAAPATLLSKPERDVFAIAYKNVTGSKRDAIRVLVRSSCHPLFLSVFLVENSVTCACAGEAAFLAPSSVFRPRCKLMSCPCCLSSLCPTTSVLRAKTRRTLSKVVFCKSTVVRLVAMCVCMAFAWLSLLRWKTGVYVLRWSRFDVYLMFYSDLSYAFYVI